MHSGKKTGFNQQSPSKLYLDAAKHSSKFQKLIQMPLHQLKVNRLKSLAQNKKTDVKTIIDKNISQNDLFRKLQEEDLNKRDTLLNKIQDRIQKINNIKSNTLRKRSEDFHKINQKFLKKHIDHEHKDIQFSNMCQKRFHQLTSELLQFYKSQKNKQSKQWKRLRSLKTCHQQANRMIERRQSLKQQFALQTDKQIEIDYNKNCPKLNPLLEIRKNKRSQRLQKAAQTYQMNLSNRQNHFIQVYASDIDAANKMDDFKEQVFSKSSNQIHKKIKQSHQKTHNKKLQIEHENAITPQKCINKMNQTMNSKFKMTMTDSTFHSTCKSWFNKNNIRKLELKEIQNRRDDIILSRHIDTSRLNNGDESLNNTFLDLKMKAGFNAKEFL